MFGFYRHEESEGQINYVKLVSGFNWRENPAPVRQTTPIKVNYNNVQ